MKHAPWIALTALLSACGPDHDAAHRETFAAEPAADGPHARTPATETMASEPFTEASTTPPAVLDTRPTDPVGTDAQIVSDDAPPREADAGLSDALLPPGTLPDAAGTEPADPLTPLGGAGATLATTDAAKSGAAKPGAKPPAALAEFDADFVARAAVVTEFEVEISRLAVLQATSPKVRDFAQLTSRDHEDAQRELAEATRSKGNPPHELDTEHQRQLSNLRDLKGVDFDREFRAMQATTLANAISLYDRAAVRCTDEALKSYAAKWLPVLREHQQKLNEIPATNSGV